MAGLPRSGSTLLKSILNQNPKIHCSPISPILELIYYNQQYFLTSEQALAYPKPEQEHLIISNIINQFYSDRKEEIVIDHCRAWVNNLERIKPYITEKPKILCPVRDVLEILTSFITMIHRNRDQVSFIDKALIEKNILLTDDNRCDLLMCPVGIVDQSLWAFKEGYRKGDGQYFYNIEYEDLINEPEKTLKGIYDYLELDYFSHDFKKIENRHRERDAEIWGLSDMHDVRKELKKTSPKPEEVLSDYVLNKYSSREFWRQKHRTFLL
jgi:sulfotransferase